MICNNCKQSYDDNLSTCPYCGAAKAAATDTIPQQQQPQQYQPPQYQQVPPHGYQTDSPAKGPATGSLVCGIIAIVMGFLVPIVGIILGIVAITMGNKARRMLPGNQSGMATAGFICGIIGIVIAVIFWIVNAVLLASFMSYLY